MRHAAPPRVKVLGWLVSAADSPGKLNCCGLPVSEETGPNETPWVPALPLGPGFEDKVKWRLGRAPEMSKSATYHYVPQALLTGLSAESKTDLLR
jgi:hypothetical protein